MPEDARFSEVSNFFQRRAVEMHRKDRFRALDRLEPPALHVRLARRIVARHLLALVRREPRHGVGRARNMIASIQRGNGFSACGVIAPLLIARLPPLHQRGARLVGELFRRPLNCPQSRPLRIRRLTPPREAALAASWRASRSLAGRARPPCPRYARCSGVRSSPSTFRVGHPDVTVQLSKRFVRGANTPSLGCLSPPSFLTRKHLASLAIEDPQSDR